MKLATITGAEFIALFPFYEPLAGQQMRRIAVRDSRYAIPQLAWLRGEFRDYYRRELFLLDLTSWSAEDNDCDNRADLYRVLAQVCKARMRLGDGLALAVAYVEYWNARAAVPGWHAINAAVTEDRRLVFIEPAYETGTDLVTLLPVEAARIRAIEI